MTLDYFTRETRKSANGHDKSVYLCTSRALRMNSHASISFMSFNTIVISVRHSSCPFNITSCVLITIYLRSWSDTFDFPELWLKTTQYIQRLSWFYVIIRCVFFTPIKTLRLTLLSSSYYQYNIIYVW